MHQPFRRGLRRPLFFTVLLGLAIVWAGCDLGAGADDPVLSAAFSVSPDVRVSDSTLTFTDASTSSEGAITAWSWDFGDGETAEGETTAHVYDEAGTYAVQLTVTDEAGNTERAIEEVEVTPSPGDALVGAWTISRITVTTYLTTSAGQQYIDPDAEAEGSLSLSGAVEADLPFLRRTLLGPAVPYLASTAAVSEIGHLQLDDDGERVVQLVIPPGDEEEAFIQVGADSENRFAWEAGTIDVDTDAQSVAFDAVTFARDGETVTVDGSLTAIREDIAADQETAVDSTALDVLANVLSVTFEADGTFTTHTQNTTGDEITATGTWSMEEGEMTLVPDGDLPPPFEQEDNEQFAFQVSEKEFVANELGNPLYDPQFNSYRSVYATMYGLDGGTVTQVSQRGAYHFVPSDDAAVLRADADAWLRRLERVRPQ